MTVGYDFTATYDPWFWFREHKVFLSIASPIALILLLFTGLLFTRPLWNLRLYRSIKMYQVVEQISVPAVGPVRPARRETVCAALVSSSTRVLSTLGSRSTARPCRKAGSRIVKARRLPAMRSYGLGPGPRRFDQATSLYRWAFRTR